MNGTRPFIETLAELPMDAWTPPAARTDAQAYAPDPDGEAWLRPLVAQLMLAFTWLQ